MTGTYSAVKFTEESSIKLHDFCKKLLNVKSLFLPSQYHSTIVYSRKMVPFDKNGNMEPIIIDPKTYEFHVFDEDPSYLVLAYQNEEITELWKESIDLGATWDFDTYRPHISVAIVDKNFKVPESVPSFPMVVNKIYTEDLDLNYQPSTTVSDEDERRRKNRK